MYEEITYEDLLDRMLERVPDSIDKREGSVIYDALAPAAAELQLMYIELDTILNETFADTASREYLIRRAKERGITPEEATYAVLKGEFNIEVPIGSRFNCNDLNYVVEEKLEEDFKYKVRCESTGTAGNKNMGDMIPIDYIEGLEYARLTEVLIPGEDEENTEVFRKRYFASFDSKAYGGNVQDYLEKTNSIPGVGSTKVTPVWNGGGTVKLTILDSTFNVASAELIKDVQNKIDPTGDGHGVGIAPIGHVVTVDTAEGIIVNISTSITFDESFSFEQLKEQIKEKVEGYMLELRKEWANQTNTVVRIAQIEARIMSVNGVLDIQNTKLNESADNLLLTNYQVPVLGEITNG